MRAWLEGIENMLIRATGVAPDVAESVSTRERLGVTTFAQAKAKVAWDLQETDQDTWDVIVSEAPCFVLRCSQRDWRRYTHDDLQASGLVTVLYVEPAEHRGDHKASLRHFLGFADALEAWCAANQGKAWDDDATKCHVPLASIEAEPPFRTPGKQRDLDLSGNDAWFAIWRFWLGFEVR